MRKKFLDILKRDDLDPKSLVEAFDNTGKKTVLTDKVCSGISLMSFIDMMTAVAEDQKIGSKFPKAIHYHVIAINNCFPGHRGYVANSAQEKPKSTITAIIPSSSSTEIDIIQRISADDTLRENSERIMASFDVAASCPTLEHPNNGAVQAEIKGVLNYFVDKLLIQNKAENPLPRHENQIIQYTPA